MTMKTWCGEWSTATRLQINALRPPPPSAARAAGPAAHSRIALISVPTRRMRRSVRCASERCTSCSFEMVLSASGAPAASRRATHACTFANSPLPRNSRASYAPTRAFVAQPSGGRPASISGSSGTRPHASSQTASDMGARAARDTAREPQRRARRARFLAGARAVRARRSVRARRAKPGGAWPRRFFSGPEGSSASGSARPLTRPSLASDPRPEMTSLRASTLCSSASGSTREYMVVGGVTAVAHPRRVVGRIKEPPTPTIRAAPRWRARCGKRRCPPGVCALARGRPSSARTCARPARVSDESAAPRARRRDSNGSARLYADDYLAPTPRTFPRVGGRRPGGSWALYSGPRRPAGARAAPGAAAVRRARGGARAHSDQPSSSRSASPSARCHGSQIHGSA